MQIEKTFAFREESLVEKSFFVANISLLPMITPILQSEFLCAHDISVPVESLSTAITDIPTSFCDENDIWDSQKSTKKRMEREKFYKSEPMSVKM